MGINNTVCNTESKYIAFVENCEYLSLAVLFKYWCISAHQSIMESAKFVIVSAKGSSAKRWRHRSGRSNG
jgi:hypothetical protein